MQGRQEDAEALIREIHARNPDYLFARVSVAKMALRDGDTGQARQLLESLLQRKKLHFSEFDNLCTAFIDLHLAEDNQEGARTWFEMWESADPENSKLVAYRRRVGKRPRFLGKFRK